MKNLSILKGVLTSTLLATMLMACSKDSSTSNNGGNSGGDGDDADGKFYIATTITAASGSSNYMLTSDDVSSGSLTIKGNGKELLNDYTWVQHNQDRIFGLIYLQGNPGLGITYRLNSNGELTKYGGDVEIVDRFTSYGPFSHYAITSVGGYLDATSQDTVSVFNFFDLENGNANTRKLLKTSNFVGNGQQATFSGVVDLGDGTFMTGIVLSDAKPAGSSGGGSTGDIRYPDSCWVVKLDENLNIKTIFRDGRQSYTSGRYRSQYYSMLAPDDNGNVYAFSGAYENNTTKKASVIRINKGATSFDPNFYMDIQSVANNHKFKRVWHITGDYFLLELYNIEGNLTNTLQGATGYGIVNTSSKSFNWLNASTGMPDSSSITSTGLPFAKDQKIYLPLTVKNMKPAIYIIDPVANTAKRGLEVDAESISSIGYLKKTSE